MIGIRLLNKHAPMKTLTKHEIKLKKKPWLTPGLLVAIRKKRTLFKKFKEAKMCNRDSGGIYQTYKSRRDLINTLKRKSKRNYFHKYFKDNCHNSKNIWKGINYLTNRRGIDKRDIFLEENGLITDQSILANKFNQYFIGIAGKLSSKIANKNSKFQDYLKNPNKSTLFLNETTPDEILKVINNLDANKSSDIYDIAPKFVKLSAQAVSQLLTIIFNRSINEGCFPEAMKKAKIIPLHKGGIVLSVSNYRPISLLPIFSKIFERLVYNRLIDFVEKNKIITQNQFGFQKNKSTEMAVTSIISQITNAFEKKESSYCVFLDFAKAFDTVNHQILIEKLNYYGVKNKALDWFKSYLTNRTQLTLVGDKLSDIGYIQHGVPQGSVLGPLLFLLYINDITKSSNVLKFFLFADDTAVYISDKNNPETEAKLNNELSKVSDWLAANKLSLNISKSNFMHFHSGNSKKPSLDIKIDGTHVEEKTVIKYLGTLIDNKLNWQPHIQLTKTKLSKAIGIISKIRYFATENVLLNMYYSFIQSIVNYNLLNWSSATLTNLDPIRNSIKKVVRIITFENKYEHTKPLFERLNVLPFEYQIKHKQAIFMWKLFYRYIPSPIKDLFTVNNYNPLRFNLPKANTELEKRLLTYSNVKTWNIDVPSHLKNITSQKHFSKKYKEHLITLLKNNNN